MAKRIKQHVTLGGKAFWVTGETQQDLFDAYLQHAIDEGSVVLPGSIPNTALPPAENLFENHAWKWYKAAYSKKMIEELLLTLGMILNAAKEDGLISINPAKSKRLRNPSNKKRVREALTSDEADGIESHLQDIPQLRDRRYVAMFLKFPARCEDIRGLQMDHLLCSIDRHFVFHHVCSLCPPNPRHHA